MATILLVDDRPVNRQVLASLLGPMGHRLIEAGDCLKSLDLVRSERPDLVIADVQMPGMNGFEFLRQLRTDPAIACTKVILASATFQEEETIALANRCGGVTHILPKPCDPAVVLRTVNAVLGLPPAVPDPPAREEFDRDHLKVLNDTLARKVEELEAVRSRLTVLVELSRDLAVENNADALLAMVCRAARRIVDARYAAIAVSRDENRPIHHVRFAESDDLEVRALDAPPLNGGLLAEVVRERSPRRLEANRQAPATLGLPTGHPEFTTLLAVPLTTDRAHGWLCLTEKNGAERFSEEDERLACTLASETAVALENVRRLEKLRGHTARLEQEIIERARVEESLREAGEELEKKVEQRTAELTATVSRLGEHNRDMALLGEMTETLQLCRRQDETWRMIARYGERLFPVAGGALYVTRGTGRLVEQVMAWGPLTPETAEFQLDDCWAVRRGRVHVVSDAGKEQTCPHAQRMDSSPSAGSPLVHTLCVPLIAQGEALGVLYFSLALSEAIPPQVCERLFGVEGQQLARAAGDSAAISLSTQRLQEALQMESVHDLLTGLFNRKYLDEFFERELEQSRRKQRPLSVVLCDVDHFKGYNDQHGHETGDLVLRQLAGLIGASTRSSDIACRYGGEEFVLILREATLENARARAEALREAVSGFELKHRGRPIGRLTVSAGVAAFPEHGDTTAELLRAADAALYRAKRDGRDRVHVAALSSEA